MADLRDGEETEPQDPSRPTPATPNVLEGDGTGRRRGRRTSLGPLDRPLLRPGREWHPDIHPLSEGLMLPLPEDET